MLSTAKMLEYSTSHINEVFLYETANELNALRFVIEKSNVHISLPEPMESSSVSEAIQDKRFAQDCTEVCAG